MSLARMAPSSFHGLLTSTLILEMQAKTCNLTLSQSTRYQMLLYTLLWTWMNLAIELHLGVWHHVFGQNVEALKKLRADPASALVIWLGFRHNCRNSFIQKHLEDSRHSVLYGTVHCEHHDFVAGLIQSKYLRPTTSSRWRRRWSARSLQILLGAQILQTCSFRPMAGGSQYWTLCWPAWMLISTQPFHRILCNYLQLQWYEWEVAMKIWKCIMRFHDSAMCRLKTTLSSYASTWRKWQMNVFRAFRSMRPGFINVKHC